MSTKALETSTYISLDDAKKLNNQIPCEQAWVYNPHLVKVSYAPVTEHDSHADVELKKKAFFKHYESANTAENMHLHPECWQIHTQNRFVNKEQIAHLINLGRFFYAPKKKGVKKLALLKGIEF